MGYTKGDAPAAAEMARKDANQTGKGIKLEERNKILTPFYTENENSYDQEKLEKKESIRNDDEKRDDLKNSRSALLNSKAPYSTQEHAPLRCR